MYEGDYMKYLTVKEMAKRMRVCEQTIRIAIHNGRLYAIKPGGGKRAPYRIPETELERLQIASKVEMKEKGRKAI